MTLVCHDDEKRQCDSESCKKEKEPGEVHMEYCPSCRRDEGLKCQWCGKRFSKTEFKKLVLIHPQRD